MKALLLLCLVLAFTAAPAWAASSASVRVAECTTSLDQVSRTMAVEGRMRVVPGARKLQMGFELQTRPRERAKWARVPAPGFGAWNTADPAPRRYVFEKRVEALAAPGQYRMVVRFRWLGTEDQVLSSTRRTSKSCAQIDLRPDLEPERIGVGAAEAPAQRRYLVPVTNAGRSPAAPFDAVLTVNGTRLRPVAVVTGLPAGGRSELLFDGPPCRPGTVLLVDVDTGGAVDERDEDNRLTRDCPG